MGLWRISRAGPGRGLSVVYVNRHTGAVFPCGESAPEQSSRAVIEWAVEQAEEGDVIVYGHQVYCRVRETHDRSPPSI